MKSSALPVSTSIDESDMRQRILHAAFHAFTENGYAGTSTLAIATRAKVSKRDLYGLFENKQAMLVACIKSRTAAMRAQTLEVQQEKGVIMFGTPDQVAHQIRRFHERVGGLDHLLMMQQAGHLDHARTVRSMTLFAREVYPQIKDLPGIRQRAANPAAE